MFPKTWNEYAFCGRVFISNFNGIKNMSKIPKINVVRIQMQEDSPVLYVVNICKQQITFRELIQVT